MTLTVRVDMTVTICAGQVTDLLKAAVHALLAFWLVIQPRAFRFDLREVGQFRFQTDAELM